MKTKKSLKLVSLTLLCATGLTACGNSIKDEKFKGEIDIWIFDMKIKNQI